VRGGVQRRRGSITDDFIGAPLRKGEEGSSKGRA